MDRNRELPVPVWKADLRDKQTQPPGGFQRAGAASGWAAHRQTETRPKTREEPGPRPSRARAKAAKFLGTGAKKGGSRNGRSGPLVVFCPELRTERRSLDGALALSVHLLTSPTCPWSSRTSRRTVSGAFLGVHLHRCPARAEGLASVLGWLSPS